MSGSGCHDCDELTSGRCWRHSSVFVPIGELGIPTCKHGMVALCQACEMEKMWGMIAAANGERDAALSRVRIAEERAERAEVEAGAIAKELSKSSNRPCGTCTYCHARPNRKCKTTCLHRRAVELVKGDR